MAAMSSMATIVAMAVMVFVVAAIVAMAGMVFVVAAIVAMAVSHGSHVKETCTLLLEAEACHCGSSYLLLATC